MKGYIVLDRDFKIQISECTYINNSVLDEIEDWESFFLNLLSDGKPIKVEADFSTYYINPSRIAYIQEVLNNSPIDF